MTASTTIDMNIRAESMKPPVYIAAAAGSDSSSDSNDDSESESSSSVPAPSCCSLSYSVNGEISFIQVEHDFNICQLEQKRGQIPYSSLFCGSARMV